MTDYTKKPEVPHVPSGPTPMQGSEGLTLAEANKARSDAATADKHKRESGKDKEQHKR